MVTNGNHELIGKTIEEVTNIPVAMEIPYDKNIDLSMAIKAPVVEYKPNSLASISFMKLASLLAEKDYEAPMNLSYTDF